MTVREDRLALYDRVCQACSSLTTRAYSTSFSRSIRVLGPDVRDAVFAIYGFVRLVDEVVDSFQGYRQRVLFERLRAETYEALADGISTNPILQAFQRVYHAYGIERRHVDLFFESMERDLTEKTYDRNAYETYITGSAEVVGLMCLKVFVRGDDRLFEALSPAAVRLGAAFQKVNFLRDVKEDYQELGRTYFPNVDLSRFNAETKRTIEREIEEDLRVAYRGIVRLPRDTRFGVYLAYRYYRRLLERIRRVPSSRILQKRIRVPGFEKAALWLTAYTRHRCNHI